MAVWIVSIRLAAMFVFSGGIKLLQPGQVKPMFVHYGYAPWFATLIGISEALGGIGLLVPRLAGIAAIGFSIIMSGSVYTHFSHPAFRHAIQPPILLIP